MKATLELFKNAIRRISLARDAVIMSSVYDNLVIEMRVRKAKEAVDNLEQHLNGQRCSLCHGTGRVLPYHDVEEYYKD